MIVFCDYVNNISLDVCFEAHDLFVVGSTIIPSNVFLFLDVNCCSDFLDIEIHNFVFNVFVEFRVPLLDIFPILVSNEESVRFTMCFIDGLRSTVVATLKSSEDELASKSDAISHMSVDFVSYVYIADHCEMDRIYGLQLVDNNGTRLILDWFELLQEITHEVLVQVTSPIEIAVRIRNKVILKYKEPLVL